MAFVVWPINGIIDAWGLCQTSHNSFASIYMPDEMPEERQPIALDAIRRIQHEFMTVDDENRWLLAFISDTGMRLSEAAGLARDDILLDANIPHVIIRPHPWRRLKTKGSERTLPLVGCSTWIGPFVESSCNRTERRICAALFFQPILTYWLSLS